MKTRSSSSLYKIECYIFKGINRYFERKTLNIFFGTITHMGGATFTISLIIFLLVLTSGSLRGIAITSAISLAISHISVRIFKKFLPRKRPYLTIHNAKYPTNPLMDHSFPSGHTTAIFSVIIPFLLYEPHMTFLLLPVAISVGISRIYLGLHYPSDVLVGMCLGSIAGIVSYYQFIPLFI